MRHRELARCAPSSTRLCWAYYEEPLMRNTVGYFRTGGKDPLARFVLQTAGRQDPQHHECFHFDRERAVLTHTQAPDLIARGGIGRIELRRPVHVTVAIGIA